MALIECSECKSKISNTAAVCPQCGYKHPKKRNWYMTGFLVLLVALGSVKLGSMLNSIDEKSVAQSANSLAKSLVPLPSDSSKDQDTSAKTACQNFVRPRMKKPFNAEFPYADKFVVTHNAGDDNVVMVSGSVFSPGEGSRSFNCTISERSPDTWKLLEVAFFG